MLVLPQRIQKSNTARNEINKANYFANRLAFVFKNQKRELLTSIAPTVDSTSIIRNELVCANAATNLYFNKNFVQTTAGTGDGSYTWLIVAKIAAADGTVSNLVGQKNDLSGSPYSQGLLLAHANTAGGYSANSIVLYEFSNITSSSVASTVAVNSNKYQTIIGSRIGGTQYICVDGVVNSANTTAAKTTPATERTVLGNSGKATNDDAGAFNSLLACGWNRGFSPAELIALSQNPWQIFLPDRNSIFLPATAVTLTYLRPSADISTGSWTPSTGTTLYTTLDEVSASDADYIQTSTTSSCEIRLAAGATPNNRDNHTIRYRILAGSGTLTAVLKCGSTTIKSWNHTLTGSAQNISNTLTNGEATNITDYSDLRVVFTSS